MVTRKGMMTKTLIFNKCIIRKHDYNDEDYRDKDEDKNNGKNYNNDDDDNDNCNDNNNHHLLLYVPKLLTSIKNEFIYLPHSTNMAERN